MYYTKSAYLNDTGYGAGRFFYDSNNRVVYFIDSGSNKPYATSKIIHNSAGRILKLILIQDANWSKGYTCTTTYKREYEKDTILKKEYHIRKTNTMGIDTVSITYYGENEDAIEVYNNFSHDSHETTYFIWSADHKTKFSVLYYKNRKEPDTVKITCYDGKKIISEFEPHRKERKKYWIFDNNKLILTNSDGNGITYYWYNIDGEKAGKQTDSIEMRFNPKSSTYQYIKNQKRVYYKTVTTNY